MAPENSSPTPTNPSSAQPSSADVPQASSTDAAEHVAEAHRILNELRGQSIKHPDLDAAIGRLELALSILTTNTGGML